MAKRIIENRRMHDTNIMKNVVRVPTKQEFSWPDNVVRTFKERESIIAALQVFLQINQANLKLEGRDREKDRALVESATLVLGRIG